MALTDYTIDTSGTPQDVQRRQALADLLMKQGSDSTPAAGGKNGGWITALNRGLAGALSGYQRGQANQTDLANRQSGQAASDAYVKSLMGQPSVATGGTVPAMLNQSAPQADTSDKIYSQDQLNPMDEPRGDARKNYIATLLGEEKPGSPEALGASNVIRNRAVDGGYGGDTPDAVVQSPKQFSPWNDQAGRDRMAKALQNPADVAKANDTIDQTYGVGKYAAAGPNDPTEGKTHFYDPASMVPVNSVPKWAQGKEGQKIGNTLFFDDPSETPQNAQYAQGQLPSQGQVTSAAGQPDPDRQRKAVIAFQTAMNPNVPAAVREMAKADYERMSKPEPIQALGDGYIVQGGKIVKAYEPEDKTPASKLEYDTYVKDEKAAGRAPIPYGQFTGKVDAPGSGVNFEPSLSGQPLLEAIRKADPNRAANIEGLYDGRIPFPTARSDKNMTLIGDAQRVYPDLDAGTSKARFKFMTDYGSQSPSSIGGQKTLMQTAFGHLAEGSGYAGDLNNSDGGGFAPVGHALNYIDNHLFTSKAKIVNQLEDAVQKSSGEVGKLYSGSAGGGVHEREDTRSRLGGNKTAAELAGGFETARDLIMSKQKALIDQATALFGPEKAAKFDFIGEPGRIALEKLNHNIDRLNGKTKEDATSIKPLEVGQSHTDGDVTITKISH